MAHFRSFHRMMLTSMDFLAEDDPAVSFYTFLMRERYTLLFNKRLIRRFIPRLTGYKNVARDLPDDCFQFHFRVSRRVYDILLEHVAPIIVKQQNSGGQHVPLSPNKQLQIFLWYLCNQESMREVSQLYGVTKSTVYTTVKSVCDAVLTTRERLIVWPDQNRRQVISNAVQQESGLPGVVGFLDGTHIRMSGTIGGDQDYYNRKGYPSMQLQLTVDHELRITSAYTGWSGCTHDARVLRNSQLYTQAENGTLFSQNEHLLTDSAYPLRNWLISPFRNVGNLTAQQRRFNVKLSSQRQNVERAIGHLKGRFRRLREVPFHKSEDISKLIITACICHNICVMADDDIDTYIQTGGQPLHPNNFQNVYQNGYHGVARRLFLQTFA